MSEKRFTVDNNGIYDNQEKKHFKFIAYDWIDCDIYECCEKLNEQQSTIDKLEQRDYYNQSERYKILGRAIELTANYIANSDEEHYDFCALVTEFEKELLDDE